MDRYIQRVRFVAGLLLSFVLFACGGGGGGGGGDFNRDEPGQRAPLEQQLIFDEFGPMSGVVGEVILNNVTSLGSGNVTWSSSDGAIATVNSRGEVSLVGPGTVKITAVKAADSTYKEASASYSVNVRKIIRVLSFDIPGNVVADVNVVFTNVGIINGQGSIHYASENESIAHVDPNTGEVTLLAKGDVTITASVAEDNQYTAVSSSYLLTVQGLNQSLSFEVPTPPIQITHTDYFNKLLNNNSTGEISYQSSDENIARVSELGLVTGVAAGEVAISVSVDGDQQFNSAQASYTLTYLPAEQQFGFDSSSPLVLYVGQNHQYQLVKQGAGAVSFESTAPSVLSIDDLGFAVALAEGNASLIARIEADSQYESDMAQLNIRVNLIPRSLAFEHAGPVNVVVDQTYSNPATASVGTGMITYQSSNESIASVNNSGVITAKSAGNAVITASILGDGVYSTASAGYQVSISKVGQAIQFLEPGPVSLEVYDTYTNTLLDGPGSGAISYQISEPSIASVNQSGLVTALKSGAATVNAFKAADEKYLPASSSYEVVISLKSQSITFSNGSSVSLYVGDSHKVVAGGGAGSGSISYSSNNTAVFSVDQTGNGMAKSAGYATVLAAKQADDIYASAQASYSVEVKPIPDTFTFEKNGPSKLIVGQNYINRALGPGSGIVTYRSEDEGVATVDAAGIITANAPGVTSISATKAADSTYLEAYAALGVEVKPKSVLVNITVGSGSSDLFFPTDYDDVEFVRSSDPNCDFINYSACEDGAFDVLNGAIFGDTSLSSAKESYFQLVFGDSKASSMISSKEIRKTIFYVFNGEIFAFGPSSIFIEPEKVNAIYSSKDGENWVLRNAHPEFESDPTQYYDSFTVVEFNGRLWAIGGSLLSFDFGYYSSIWSSVDGVHWVLEKERAEFSYRYYPAVVNFKGKLWLFGGTKPANGGSSSDYLNDTWSSTDGITWVKEQDRIDSSYTWTRNLRVINFKNKLYMIDAEWPSGSKWPTGTRKILTSVDGFTWVENSVNALLGGGSVDSVVEFNEKIYVYALDPNQDYHDGKLSDYFVWSSSDGVSWLSSNQLSAYSYSPSYQYYGDVRRGVTGPYSSLLALNGQLLAPSTGTSSRATTTYKSSDAEIFLSQQDFDTGYPNRVYFGYDEGGAFNTFTVGDKLYNFSWNGLEYECYSTMNGRDWELQGKMPLELYPIPIVFNGVFYTQEKNLYSRARVWRSEDCRNWNRVTTLPAELDSAVFIEELFIYKGKLWFTSMYQQKFYVASSEDGDAWAYFEYQKVAGDTVNVLTQFEVGSIHYGLIEQYYPLTEGQPVQLKSIGLAVQEPNFSWRVVNSNILAAKNAPSATIKYHLFAEHAGQFYTIISIDQSFQVWRSVGGELWSLISESVPPVCHDSGLFSLSGRLLLKSLAGTGCGTWSSIDGVNWQKEIRRDIGFN